MTGYRRQVGASPCLHGTEHDVWKECFRAISWVDWFQSYHLPPTELLTLRVKWYPIYGFN